MCRSFPSARQGWLLISAETTAMLLVRTQAEDFIAVVSALSSTQSLLAEGRIGVWGGGGLNG